LAKKLPAGKARFVSKDTIAVNLTGVEARKRRTVHIPEGNYRAKVVEVKRFTSKSENPGITWTFELVEGKFSGTRFWERTMLVDQSLWTFRGVLQALSPPVKIRDATMEFKLSALVGRTCALEIVDGEYEGKVRSEVNDVFSEELLESDESEDEEEAEEHEEAEEDDWEEEEVDEEDEEEEDEEEEDEEEEEEDEDWEEEEDEEEEKKELDPDDLQAMDLGELREVATRLGFSTKPAKGKTRLSSKALRQRLLDHLETEELDLDEEEL
jgi:hypothetical protein